LVKLLRSTWYVWHLLDGILHLLALFLLDQFTLVQLLAQSPQPRLFSTANAKVANSMCISTKAAPMLK